MEKPFYRKTLLAEGNVLDFAKQIVAEIDHINQKYDRLYVWMPYAHPQSEGNPLEIHLLGENKGNGSSN